ncbi:MAG: class I SAM-dependent methyltransferase [Nitrospinales bacterium]
MFNFIYEKYWEFGFKSHLYDLLTPEEYFLSFRKVAGYINTNKNKKILDAGCGSGLLLEFIKPNLNNGEIYYGTDYLLAGLVALNKKADILQKNPNIHSFRSDLTSENPMREDIFDTVVAHFCIYAMGNEIRRKAALKNLRASIKKDGTFIVVNPSCNYNPERIIQSSLALLKGNKSYLQFIITKWFLYPLTLHLGLRHIHSQLKKDKWHAYTKEEFCDEISDAGFQIMMMENVYADSAYLAVCKPIVI